MKYIGEKLEGKEYEERKATYALISNDVGNIAIVQQGNMYNMIGGKIEYGEESKGALIRETKEEIGYELKNIKYLDSLGCYYYVDFLDKYCLAEIDFYNANFGKKICEPIDKDIKLVWVKPEDVVDKMYFEYHRYFLKEYLGRNKK